MDKRQLQTKRRIYDKRKEVEEEAIVYASLTLTGSPTKRQEMKDVKRRKRERGGTVQAKETAMMTGGYVQSNRVS
ncbi:hypothetical protein TWF696_003712 [Orbilia brochopaga]|uniref:Uncharacterized protein n=1 Tax=Orbilia brochopaga TaxID=3140254 RepID=A0AAV9V4T6_9PEZI